MQQFINSLKVLTIRQTGDTLHFNDSTFIQVFDAGQQAVTILVDVRGTKLVLAFMKNDVLSKKRIQILEMIQNMPNVVKQLGSKKIDTVFKYDLSKTNLKLIQKLDANRLVSVCEYYDYQQLSIKPFLSNQQFNSVNLSGAGLQAAVNFVKQFISSIKQLHDQNIYHFDIKPENILISEQTLDFKLIDFGSAQVVEQVDAKASLLIEKAHTAWPIQVTELFSSSRFDSQHGVVLCDKFDTYSVGCVIYYVLMNEFLQFPMESYTEQFSSCVSIYGIVVADLISGLTRQNMVQRYTLEQALNHPLFSAPKSKITPNSTSKQIIPRLPVYTSGQNPQLRGRQYSAEIIECKTETTQHSVNSLFSFILQNNANFKLKVVSKLGIKKSLSFSDLYFTTRKQSLSDDQHNLNYQNAIRHNTHFNRNVICYSFAQRQINNFQLFPSATRKQENLLIQAPFFIFVNYKKLLDYQKYLKDPFFQPRNLKTEETESILQKVVSFQNIWEETKKQSRKTSQNTSCSKISLLGQVSYLETDDDLLQSLQTDSHCASFDFLSISENGSQRNE
ncbi:Kinase [Hexamita inflata]|uniref:CAMK CAMKL n=1 Tax=Hexamita inflata TaxID=28002 RepID=A0AA86RZC0_9EUKA|nr:CAMK CAMKL [Hexamita inflata]